MTVSDPEPPPPDEPDEPTGPAGDVFPAERPALRRLSDVEPERIDWLWPGYLARGKLHIFDGDPGVGKSTATADLAARVSTGKPWPDGQPGTTPAGVVLLSAEDGLADTIRPRLDAAGADTERVLALTGIDYLDRDGEWAERLPALPRDTPLIRQAIEQVQAGLLVIDPLMAYLGDAVNEYRDKEIRRALGPLIRTAETTDTAIILVRHFNKNVGASELYRGGGAIGIIGAARLGYAVARDPHDPDRVILAATKANIAAKPTSLAYRLVDSPDHGCARIDWDGPVEYTAADLLREPDDGDQQRDKSAAVKWLRDYLTDQGGTAPAQQVLTAGLNAGHAKRTLQHARVRARVTSKKDGFGADGHYLWSLPDPPDDSGPEHAHGSRAGTHGAHGVHGTHAPEPSPNSDQPPTEGPPWVGPAPWMPPAPTPASMASMASMAAPDETDASESAERDDGSPEAALPAIGPCGRCGKPARRTSAVVPLCTDCRSALAGEHPPEKER